MADDAEGAGRPPDRPERSRTGEDRDRDMARRRGRTRPPVGRSSRPAVPVPRYRYEISELEEETGIAARTIRYYISRGLLAPAYGRGPTATYDLGHLLRLRLITRLKEEHHPLDEIRDRLGDMSDAEVEAALGVQVAPPTDTWRRIQLHPDIELHIRVPPPGTADEAFNDAVELIVGLAQPVIDRLE